MKKVNLLLLIFSYTFNLWGQNIATDTLQQRKNIQFRYEALILPTVLLGYGIVSLESPALKKINADANTKFKTANNITKIDDFMLYAPAVTVYGLNAVGIKGKNNFKDRTIVLTTAYLIMGASVVTLKNTVSSLRPDGTTDDSFPSGHTANAFVGAEFLYQEYKDVSVWYGISGYAVATGTGFLRMYNNRHWLGDVAAGAGIGILSTKMAYWVHPFIKKTFFKDKEKINGMVMPFYNGREYGLGLSMTF